MSKKMILLPMERYRELTSSVKSTCDKTTTTDVPSSSPDVKLKVLREKKMRRIRPTPVPSQPQQSQSNNQQFLSPEYLAIQSFPEKKRVRANELLKHLRKNKDRIKFDKGELEFDGIKSGGSDFRELTSALTDSEGNPGSNPGWNSLMDALEATQAPPTIYGRWKKHHKKGDWGSLQFQ